ncbi:MAG: hypothetical protein DWQ31_15310 [Planctomycetota bacterium]|nr:MAG: hypothetical protein DWQ31_15310 [Planctomycetota bacterium]REJ87423.1 MAG: hypothetical protein DWQ35_21425 [Planctomycetota bacterium]REK30785.1 MAG: hypothetical protein DWQ42_01495 [Planctomycetota bacterium]REK42165.1 MAG: hypothetical protein DWQ46_14375 [Planctomycetota bacterium]
MPSEAPDRLLAAPMLFRFAVPCLYCKGPLWGKRVADLGEEYRIASFAELDDVPSWADLRIGWNEQGLLLRLDVAGKDSAPWCRESRHEDSDGLTVWIDTRDTQTVHRATRFCNSFCFLPGGTGAKFGEPLALPLKIHRAKEDAPLVGIQELKVASKRTAAGYHLAGFIPAEALHGFDPEEHPRLGFAYLVRDRELGEQTLSVGSEFPIASDPSLWSSLELVR